MPKLLGELPLPHLMGFFWFFLLFLAGVTSSVSLAQPAVAFLEDEFNLSRRGAVAIFTGFTFLACHAAFFFMGNGVVDEMDAWGGNFCLVLFGTVEAILFAWVFGLRKAWDEIHHGADLRVPGIYRFIIGWVTPLYLLVLLTWWLYDTGWRTLLMRGVSAQARPYVLGTRLGLVALFVLLALLVHLAWRRQRRGAGAGEQARETVT
jgi:SNF family Na+-dependent transporter